MESVQLVHKEVHQVQDNDATVHALIVHENVKQRSDYFMGFSFKQTFITCLNWTVE